MLLFVLSLLILASVPLLGGHLSRLADVRLRWALLLPVGLAIQVLIIEVLADADIPHRPLHILSYAILGVFVVANLSVPGLGLMGLGGALNAVAIVANGGVMPASEHALAVAGLRDDGGFANSAAVEHPHVAFLGDVFAIPESWPLSNVFSVGDVVLLI